MLHGVQDIIDVKRGATQIKAIRHGNSPVWDDTVFGVSWDKSSNPIMTRTYDAVGMTASIGIDSAVVTNDFDTAQIYKDIQDETDAYGNVFVSIPAFYIRRTVTDIAVTCEITRYYRPGFYLPKCFWDFATGKKLDRILIGKHIASLSGDGLKLESKAGTYPLIRRNIVQMRDLARANGAGYQQYDIHVHDVLQALFEVEFATLNAQSILVGFTSGQYSDTHTAQASESNTNRIIVTNAVAGNYRVGQTISIGSSLGGNQIFYGRTITAIDTYDASNKAISFDGNPVNIAVGNIIYNTGWKSGFGSGIAAASGCIVANDGKYPCKYRGIENPWGSIWQFVDGININDYQSWVAENAENYASNVFASPYEQLSYLNANANGYAKALGHDANHPYANITSDSSGISFAQYYCDYYYQNSGPHIALVGGGWFYGSTAGPWFWYLSGSSSDASVGVGGRLVRKAV